LQQFRKCPMYVEKTVNIAGPYISMILILVKLNLAVKLAGINVVCQKMYLSIIKLTSPAQPM